MNAQKYFEQHAEELIASYAGKNVVLFFRGFVPANVRWLAHREDAVLPAGKILNEDGSISIAKIDVAKRKLVQSLMMQEEGVTVGIYEEIHRRHVAAENMMTAFLTSDLTTKQRWDLIEDYFLGHDEVVAQVLGLNEEN